MPGEPAIVTPELAEADNGTAIGGNGLSAVYALVADDFAAVNDLIPHQLTSDVELVEEISQYIVESGGKRLRPLMVLLGTRSLGCAGIDQIRLATVIEFLHTATLLHDDVVDHSVLRRGRATANSTWGNAPSVLVGDFLYSRAFQLMVELNSMPIMSILSDATNTIAEGEVMQLANVGNCEISEASYMEVIRCKTALLFQAASHTAGVLSRGTPEQVQALKLYGQHFGLAYQLVDDWLDYAGDAESMGKNVGDDLAEGKLTLPLIHALQHSNDAGSRVIRRAIEAQSADTLPDVLKVVRDSGALDYTRAAAQSQSERAIEHLQALPDSPYRQALSDLSRFCVSRLS
jgi:octaprenyl-diphosphate synthase